MKIKNFTLGPTGRFPRGSAAPDDEGEFQMAIATDHQQGIIRIDFGTPIGWMGLPSREARQFAGLLLEKADELDRRKT